MEVSMTGLIKEMSDGLAGVVETAGQNVARIEGRQRLPASGVVWSEDGVIVTAHHVLERDKDIRIGLPDGEIVTSELIGRDPSTDLAALRIQGSSLKMPNWADPQEIKVGHLVLALGRPGKHVQATLGIVSALGESWRTPTGGQVDHYLQTDVVMYPGFSGGPLVSIRGDVLGLNTSALRGVSVAIPTPTVKIVVDSLLTFGRIRQGYLGVGLQPVRLPAQVAKEIDQEIGLMVISVETKGPAEKAGITLGDTILELNGESIRSLDDLMKSLGPESIDTKGTLGVLRGGKLENLDLKIGEKR
jgi:S1-C subfamily serine protease